LLEPVHDVVMSVEPRCARVTVRDVKADAIQLVVAQIAASEQAQLRLFWAAELRHGLSLRVGTQRCYTPDTEVGSISRIIVLSLL